MQRPASSCNSYRMSKQASYNQKQRLCYFGERIISPSAVFGATFNGGIAQWRDDPVEWQQGTRGYLRRFGTRLGQSASKSTAEYASHALLHEDPRPARLGTGSVWRRLGYAASNMVFAPTQVSGGRSVGRRRLSPTPIAGALASGFVGMAWYPDRINTVPEAFRRSASSLEGSLSGFVFQEFEPDLVKLFARVFTGGKKNKASVPSTAPSTSRSSQ